MNLQPMREAYVGKRVELPGRGLLSCAYCGSHLVCYNVVPFTRVRGRNREAEQEEMPAACLICSDPKCSYTSLLPLAAKTAMAAKLHAALPEQLDTVRAWLIEIHTEEEKPCKSKEHGVRYFALP